MNDNTPQFERANYSHAIPEDIKPGTSFLSVRATDADAGDNARLTYMIDAATNPDDTFKIDASSGTIRVRHAADGASPIDREKIANYVLAVVATDHGTPPRQNTTFVSIDVTDINGRPRASALASAH